MLVPNAMRVTAAKSLSGSYGGFGCSTALISRLPPSNKSVCPSGTALASEPAASMPPAPARLSTTTATPQLSLIFSASMRATASTPPPGGYATNRRIVLLGNFCGVCARLGHETTGSRRPPRQLLRVQC